MASNSNASSNSSVQSNPISKYFTPLPDDRKGDLKRDLLYLLYILNAPVNTETTLN